MPVHSVNLKPWISIGVSFGEVGKICEHAIFEVLYHAPYDRPNKASVEVAAAGELEAAPPVMC
jgi:hypothetical protein